MPSCLIQTSSGDQDHDKFVADSHRQSSSRKELFIALATISKIFSGSEDKNAFTAFLEENDYDELKYLIEHHVYLLGVTMHTPNLAALSCRSRIKC